MPPRIIPVLDRLRQDIAADLAVETIEDACRQVNNSWRQRVLDPATTIYLFLLQVLRRTQSRGSRSGRAGGARALVRPVGEAASRRPPQTDLIAVARGTTRGLD
jgi:hypothetical protein